MCIVLYRYLDNKLFKAEMRLNHNARQSEKAVLAINEIKTGVAHLVSLLAINEKLLSNLPSSNAPMIRVDDDIAKNLSWCEERVLAINESMLLGIICCLLMITCNISLIKLC